MRVWDHRFISAVKKKKQTRKAPAALDPAVVLPPLRVQNI